MRRLLALSCFGLSLAACASILGDFDVEPKTNLDGSTPVDGGSGLTDAPTDTPDTGTEAGTFEQPVPKAVAASGSATCATVQYLTSKKTVTYCWGEQGLNKPATLGTIAGDPQVDGFYRPRLPTASPTYLVFDDLIGSGTGDWFLGRGTDGLTNATYAWGDNNFGQCALANPPAAALPNQFRVAGLVTNYDRAYAAPNHGCMIVGATAPKSIYCWGNDDNCQVRSGTPATCNGIPGGDTSVRTLEDQSTKPVGSGFIVDRMAGGRNHSCVARRKNPADDEDVVCWGQNLFGAAGPPSGIAIATPTSVGVALKGKFDLAAGENHTCAVSEQSKLTCWGRNDQGQASPVAGAPATIAPTTVNVPAGTISSLTLAGDLSCLVLKQAVRAAKAYCFGNGPKGRAAGDTAAIAAVANVEDVIQIAIGRSHACAIGRRTDAAATDRLGLWCWGKNENSKLDPHPGAAAAYDQPVQIMFPPEPK